MAKFKKGIGDNSKKKDNIFKAKKLLSIHGIKCKNNFKLELPDFVINKKLKKFKMFPKPWIAIGFSCNKTAFMKNNKPYSFYRTWRPEFFSDLINLIHSKNKKIFFFLIGAKNELNLADEVFLSGTAAEITPVIKINKRKIGAGKVGNITKLLMTTYSNIVMNKNKKYSKWLTRVY